MLREVLLDKVLTVCQLCPVGPVTLTSMCTAENEEEDENENEEEEEELDEEAQLMASMGLPLAFGSSSQRRSEVSHTCLCAILS